MHDPAAQPPQHGLDPAVIGAIARVGTSLALALPPAIARAQAAAAEAVPAPTARSVAALYARYLALFVGAGLLAGAVVHFPLAPLRYGLMACAGAVVFAAGSVGEALAGRSRAGRARYLGASLVLALGVGMVAGGIQHFADVPARAAALIPLGLVVGLGAFVARDGHRVRGGHRVALAAGAAAGALVLWLALGTLVPDAPGAATGAHAH